MQALSGDAEVRWEMQPAINSAGGLLCIWSDETFKNGEGQWFYIFGWVGC